jgi:hypothetical protein
MTKPKPSARERRAPKRPVSPEPVNEEQTVLSAGALSDQTTPATGIQDRDARESAASSSSRPPALADYRLVAAYELGVRLAQAMFVAGETRRLGWALPRRLLAQTVGQLSANWCSLLSCADLPEVTGQFVGERLSRCALLLECDPPDSNFGDYTAFDSCFDHLQTIQQQVLVTLAQNPVPSLPLRDWFALGHYLVRGAANVSRSFRLSANFSAEQIAELWTALAADGDVVEFLDQLQTRLADLMPPLSEEGSHEADMRRPQFSFMWVWPSIEKGLEQLRSRAASLQVQPIKPAASESDDPTESTSAGDSDSRKNRPAYGRDHEWLKWYEDSDAPTFHKPAKIRDKWNGLSNNERITICKECSAKIDDAEGGIDSVKKGIRKARAERQSGS